MALLYQLLGYLGVRSTFQHLLITIALTTFEVVGLAVLFPRALEPHLVY
jgi:hypothetical protein